LESASHTLEDFMLIVWGALIVAGLTIRGLIWLALLGIVLVLITGVFGVMGPVHSASFPDPFERPILRRVRREAGRESLWPSLFGMCRVPRRADLLQSRAHG
jgi:hypothetical protein